MGLIDKFKKQKIYYLEDYFYQYNISLDAKQFYRKNRKKISFLDQSQFSKLLDMYSNFIYSIDLISNFNFSSYLKLEELNNLGINVSNLNIDFLNKIFRDEIDFLDVVKFKEILNTNSFDKYIDYIDFVKNENFAQYTSLFSLSEEMLVSFNKFKNFENFDGLKVVYSTLSPEIYLFDIISDIDDDIDFKEIFDIELLKKMDESIIKKLYSGKIFHNTSTRINNVKKYIETGNVELLKLILEKDGELDNYSLDVVELIGRDEVKKLIIHQKLNASNTNYYTMNKIIIKKLILENKLPEKYISLIDFIEKLSSYDVKSEELNSLYFSTDTYIEIYKEFKQEIEKHKKNYFSEQLEKTTKLAKQKEQYIESIGCNVSVFDDQSIPFYMLINVVSENSPTGPEIPKRIKQNPELIKIIENNNNIMSSSLISQRFLLNFSSSTDDLIFGYNSIPEVNYVFTSSSDSGTLNFTSENINRTIELPETIIDKSVEKSMQSVDSLRTLNYNEIGVYRKNPQTGERLLPTCIVCYDEINEVSINAAKALNLPIYLIKTKEFETIHKFSKANGSGFTI